MKKLKVLLSVLLSAMLVLSMAAPVFADINYATGGSITIGDAVKNHTYKAYQVFDIETITDNYAQATYKVNADFAAFFNVPANKAYVTYSSDNLGYITGVNEAKIEEFAKALIAYAEENEIEPAASQTASSSTVSFTGLELGYYVVSTTLGTLCSLNSTAPNATIEEKNTEPTIEKKVDNDDTAAFDWEDSNTAKIGDVVNFQITVKAKKGAEAYIVEDTMSNGLVFDASSLVIQGATKDTDYTLATGTDPDFTITFAQSYLDKITANTDIVITYSAKLTAAAVVAGEGNPNTAKLKYSNTFETAEATTKTYTWKFDLNKVDENGDELSGATFELLLNGAKVAFVNDGNNYRVATADDQTTTTVITAGSVNITGLDAKTYTLTEIAPPAGYNKLASDITVVINEDGSYTQDGEAATAVEVENKAGTLLPSTGGTGTKVLFTVGGIMMVVAFVLITSKRRMAAEK